MDRKEKEVEIGEENVPGMGLILKQFHILGKMDLILHFSLITETLSYCVRQSMLKIEVILFRYS